MRQTQYQARREKISKLKLAQSPEKRSRGENILTGRLRRNTRLIGFPEMKLEGMVEAILELMLTISHS